MKTLFLAVCAVAMLSGQASAEPVKLTSTLVDNGWQKVRRHCDQRGRCWQEGWRNPLAESYRFAALPAPREHAGESKQQPGQAARADGLSGRTAARAP